jgi:hypothetical protein
MAAMVAAPALEELVVAVLPEADPELAGVGVADAVEAEDTAVKLAGSSCPQSAFSVARQAACAAALSVSLTAAALQRLKFSSQMKVGIVWV